MKKLIFAALIATSFSSMAACDIGFKNDALSIINRVSYSNCESLELQIANGTVSNYLREQVQEFSAIQAKGANNGATEDYVAQITGNIAAAKIAQKEIEAALRRKD